MRSAFSRTDHEKPPALTEHRAIPVLLANQFSHEARWGRASSVSEQQSASALDDPPLGTEKVADLLEVVALDFNMGVGRLAAAAAGSFELTDKVLE